MCQINFHVLMGVGLGRVAELLDQMKIKLTKYQVELELGLSLAKKDRSSKLTIPVVFVVPSKQ